MNPFLTTVISKLTPKINWKEFFSFKLMDIFAIAAIIFAYIQFHDARTTLETLPTKYMADFPENMDGIISRIISPSQQKLMIISDYPIYGIYSNSDKAIRYCSEILSKATAGVKLQLVFYDYKTRKQQFIDQFNLNKDSLNNKKYFERKFIKHTCPEKKFMKDDKDKINFNCSGHKMANFLSVFRDSIPTNCNNFFEIMNKHHKRFLDDLKLGPKVSIDTVSFPLSSAFWLSDDTDLAFSMNSLGNQAQESTFITRDNNIIGFVLKTFNNLTNRTLESQK